MVLLAGPAAVWRSSGGMAGGIWSVLLGRYMAEVLIFVICC